jgi:hypothetical protein
MLWPRAKIPPLGIVLTHLKRTHQAKINNFPLTVFATTEHTDEYRRSITYPHRRQPD